MNKVQKGRDADYGEPTSEILKVFTNKERFWVENEEEEEDEHNTRTRNKEMKKERKPEEEKERTTHSHIKRVSGSSLSLTKKQVCTIKTHHDSPLHL